jgi:hypothetical protein
MAQENITDSQQFQSHEGVPPHAEQQLLLESQVVSEPPTVQGELAPQVPLLAANSVPEPEGVVTEQPQARRPRRTRLLIDKFVGRLGSGNPLHGQDIDSTLSAHPSEERTTDQLEADRLRESIPDYVGLVARTGNVDGLFDYYTEQLNTLPDDKQGLRLRTQLQQKLPSYVTEALRVRSQNVALDRQTRDLVLQVALERVILSGNREAFRNLYDATLSALSDDKQGLRLRTQLQQKLPVYQQKLLAAGNAKRLWN